LQVVYDLTLSRTKCTKIVQHIINKRKTEKNRLKFKKEIIFNFIK